MTFLDPPEAPVERERLNAKNLKGSFLILRPTSHDIVPGVQPNSRGEIKPWEFVECDVWVFDRAGITAHDTGIRFSWWRAVAQLKDSIGMFVACRPMEQEDNSVILTALTGDARHAAETAIKEITTTEMKAEASKPVPELVDDHTGYESGTEPF